MRKEFSEFHLLRGVTIILVVFGHSVINGTQEYPILQYIIKLIYSFHMPVFFFISGFFAIKILNFNCAYERWMFLCRKFYRLMIPYLTITILSIPFKLLLSAFIKRPLILTDLITDTFLFPGNNPVSSLWFIHCLFMINIIILIYSKWIKKDYNIVIFSLLLFIIGVYVKIDFLNLSSVFRNQIFFALGILIRNNYQLFLNICFNKFIFIISILILVIVNLCEVTSELTIQLSYLLTGIMGIIMLYGGIIRIDNQRYKKVINYFGMYSYDIYLISWFTQNTIGYFLVKVLNLNYILCIFITFFSGFIPILISKYIIRKSKLLNKLILGK